MPKLARRITETSPKNFGMFAKALGASGDLIHLELGMPVHDTPAHIKEATITALRDGHVHYSDLQGIAPLREAISDKLAKVNDLDVAPDEVIVTNGLTQASFAAFMAWLDEGDEVILLDPYYPQHIGKIELAGAKAVIASFDPADDFRIKREGIAPHITPATKMICVVNPCNPTGRVFTMAELEVIADLAIAHDLIVLSDEVYEQITFDSQRHISIASLPGMKERTITTFAFTKAYAMDGWRLGYLAADARMIAPLMKITTNEVTHVNTFIQHGALAALTGPPEILEDLVADDQMRRDLVVSRLNQMPGVTCAVPEGTIYAFPNISRTGLFSQEIADRLLEEAQVVVEAGSFYGDGGEGHVRVCFGSQTAERLDEAMDRMSRFFNSLKEGEHV